MNMIRTRINTLANDLNESSDKHKDFNGLLWLTMAYETFNKHIQICRIANKIQMPMNAVRRLINA